MSLHHGTPADRHEPCPRTDEVLARFLDGDPTPESAPTEDGIAAHLEDCGTCRDTLAASRRLDAQLAAGAGIDADRAEAVLTAALRRIAPPAPARRLRRPVLAGAAIAFALVGAGFAAAWWMLPRRGPSPEEHADAAAPRPEAAGARVPGTQASGRPAPGLPGAIPLPDMRTDGPARRPTRPGLPTRAWLAETSLTDAVRANLLLRALASGLPVPGARTLEVLGSGVVAGMQRRAAAAMLAEGTEPALARWTRFAAGGLDPVLAAHLMEAGRSHRGLQRHLLRRLRGPAPDGEAFTVAVRIAAAEIDALLVPVLRREPGRLPAFAGTLAAMAERPGRTELLLQVWSDLDARGLLGTDDEETARMLFAAQPPETTGALIATAEATGNATVRERCLLALAVRRDPRAFDFLRSLVGSPRQPDAVLAAYGLSRLPAGSLEHLLEPESRRRRTLRRPWLLQAAMAGAGSATARAWLPELDLTPEERGFLATGAFTRAQFPIAAALFRERGALIH